MKKKLLFSLSLLCLALMAQAQILKPVKWQTSMEPAEAKVGDVVSLVFTATIQDDWYLYSNGFDPDLGPIMMEFISEPNDTYEVATLIYYFYTSQIHLFIFCFSTLFEYILNF